MPKTEEQIQSIKALAGEKKGSMKRRDDHHDYTERRMYMITLEIEGRQPILGRLMGDAHADMASENKPHIELSAIGKMVEAEWYGIPRYYPQIKVEALQIMPDHLHGILFVMRQLPVHLGKVISGFKAGCRKRLKEMELGVDVAAKPQPTEKIAQPAQRADTVASTQRADTVASTQKVNTEASVQRVETVAPSQREDTVEKGHRAAEQFSPQAMVSPSQNPIPPSQSPHLSPRLFASGYNDLILRSSDELSAWMNYLWDNPRRLFLKRAHPEWLRPFFGLRIGNHCFSGIGNRALLSVTRRLAVRVSRHYTHSEIETLVGEYLKAAAEGAVLVSPAISPGEKRVMRAVFDAGYPTIVMMENGFTPLSKPHGEQFYACANGTLLMLSPFEHHNEKRKISSEQCRQLNIMALDICK